MLPPVVTTDACDYGIGGVLTQLHGDTETTIAFASRTLTDCERKYSTLEKEALACIWVTGRGNMWCILHSTRGATLR